MTTVFHARPYDTFTEIKNSLRRINFTEQIRFQFYWRQFQQQGQWKNSNPILTSASQKMIFPPEQIDLFFTSMVTVLLDWSNETSSLFLALKSTSLFLAQSPSSEANSSFNANQMPVCTYSREQYNHHRQQYYRKQHQERHQCKVGKVSDQEWSPEENQH